MNFKTSVLKAVVFLYSQSIKKTSSSPPKICIAQPETQTFQWRPWTYTKLRNLAFHLSWLLVSIQKHSPYTSGDQNIPSFPHFQLKNNFRKLPYRNKKAYVKQGSYLVYFPFRVMLWALLKIRQNRKHIKKDNFLAVHSGWDLQNISAL